MFSVKTVDCIKEKIKSSNRSAGAFVHLGCGEATTLSQIREIQFDEFYLVDANEEVCKRLKHALNQAVNVHVLHALVAKESEEKIFHRTNSVQFDSLNDPQSLVSFFPNLKLVEAERREAISLERLMSGIALDVEKENVLVVDVGTAGQEILTSLKSRDLGNFSIIVLRNAFNPLSVSEKSKDVDILLKQSHFYKCLDVDSGFPFVNRIFIRNDDLINLERLSVENENLRSENKLLHEQVEELRGILSDSNSELKKFSSGYEILDKKLTSGLNNAVKQLEAFIGLQNYFSDSTLPLAFHGWPISADIAIILLAKIQENNYDLIMEFGSGTSTVLFAKALRKIEGKSAELSSNGIKKIVTFEHHEKYLNKTGMTLAEEGLSSFVDLVHAPLVEQRIAGEAYSYYSCVDKLQEIAKSLGDEKARILVLVDGPPGSTGPHARFPAMPLLLDILGEHQLDIVLDDYARREEKEIVARWKGYLNERQMSYVEEEFPCEKGAHFCRVNT